MSLEALRRKSQPLLQSLGGGSRKGRREVVGSTDEGVSSSAGQDMTFVWPAGAQSTDAARDVASGVHFPRASMLAKMGFVCVCVERTVSPKHPCWPR